MAAGTSIKPEPQPGRLVAYRPAFAKLIGTRIEVGLSRGRNARRSGRIWWTPIPPHCSLFTQALRSAIEAFVARTNKHPKPFHRHQPEVKGHNFAMPSLISAILANEIEPS